MPVSIEWPTDRIDYEPIVGRTPLRLPDGAKVVFWPLVAIEHWAVDQPMPRTIVNPPAGVTNPIPDVPNWTWHEYGNRVGFWRVKEILDEFGVRATLVINATVVETYPQIVRAALDAGWDIAGHGLIQKALPAVDDQRGDIFRTRELIASFAGSPPRGWIGPALAETQDTVDWLSEAGFEWVGDWVLDDQPVTLASKAGPLTALPYTQEHNDLSMILVQGHSSAEYADRALASFAQLLGEADRHGAKVLCITLHPYIMGVPHRVRHLRAILEAVTAHRDVKLWNASELLDWYREATG